MMRRVCRVVLLSLVWSLSGARDAAAQYLRLADGGPHFVSAPSASGVVTDVSSAPVFQRRVTIDLVEVPLGKALTAIGRLASLEFVVSEEVTPLDRRVSLSATQITVGAALYELLAGLGLDVQLSPTGASAAIVPRVTTPIVPLPARRQSSTTITGRVIDGALQTPLSQVSVRVEGTALHALSNADGMYAIPGVAPGAYHITARRVGYQALTKDVTLAVEQGTASLDFALLAAPTKLDEIVTTAVGNQRRYEVGSSRVDLQACKLEYSIVSPK